MRLYSLLLLLTFSTGNFALAQGIKGHVRDAKQEILPFATVFVKNKNTGTTTNIDGYYEIKLPAGSYLVYYQYLGYETLAKEIVVGQDFVTVDVQLQAQVVVLKEFVVKAKSEDPAYSIMRKAIAKAKYHELLVQKYNARVYIKGSGQLTGIPFYARKMLEKEGVDTSQVFITESITDLSFELPNSYTERVISVRSSGDEGQSSPNRFIQSSFYQSKVAETVSPLAPNAFNYYRFEYLGSFYDNGLEVNKIKVIPRVKGDGTFEGTIFINDGLWNIHSLDLTTVQKGFTFEMAQLCAPVREQVWMPISYKFKVWGAILGFRGEFNYVSSLSNYDITLNTDLEGAIVLIDEKLETKEEQSPTIQSIDLPEESIFSDKVMTRKEMRKTLKKYEKEMWEEEKKENKGELIISERNLSFDTLAYKRDNSFWDEFRPVPLTEKELKSYNGSPKDSTLTSKKEKKSNSNSNKKASRSDSIRKAKVDKPRKYHPEYVFTGGTYKLNKKSVYEFKPLLQSLGYNTVEGLNARMDMAYIRKDKYKTTISPTLRYGLSSNTLYGRMRADFNRNTSFQTHTLRFEGGRYISQYSDRNPVPFLLNSSATLLGERNFLKIYEKDYLKAETTQSVNDKITLTGGMEWAQRRELFNTTDFSFFDWKNHAFTPNRPFNEQLANTGFGEHQVSLLNLSIQYEPRIIYKKVNGFKSKIEGQSPIYTLNYQKGIPTFLGSDVNFDKVSVGMQHTYRWVGRRMDYFVGAGTFLNNRSAYFMDFNHYQGNRSYFFLQKDIQKFSLLDFYAMSNDRSYVQGNINQQFRRLMLTNILELRMMGIHEDLFVNHLQVQGIGAYTEVGYAIDGIGRVVRLEAVSAFRNGQFQSWNIRIGFSSTVIKFD